MSPTLRADAGLSEAQARERLLRDGPNQLPPPQHRSLPALVGSVLLQPMLLLLLACALLYALLGSAFDSGVLAASIAVVAAISVYQEARTQRTLEALRELASPRSTVVRDGVVRRIASRELVEGDRLILEEGARLACDARLLESHAMRVDESMLTGESLPVDKRAPGDLQATQLSAGSLVVQGDGVAVVTATGARTATGRIGGAMAALAPRTSRLQGDLDRMVRSVALVALLICLGAATVFAWRDGSWTAGLLVGLTLAMAIVPEEFAVVWTVMLALGAWRLARAQVLTRQPQAVEALGTITVLCVDKTGTLTCNRMELVGLHDGHTAVTAGALAAPHAELLRIAALASVREGLEPMDRAIFRLLEDGHAAAHADLLAREGVSPGRPFVRQSWRTGDGKRLVATKGAPEAVLAHCADSAQRLEAMRAQAQQWAASGRRVIAVARLIDDDGPVPDVGHEALGLLAFEDPLREDVPAALQECRRAGVRVVMVTGDAPATAAAIAAQAGIMTRDGASHDVMTGAELDALNQAQFEGAVTRVAVFARVTPAQKLRVVQALQRQGEVVGMTGDGVNDGPALRAADVGVAMGERGTDVAREAAALVLLDDRFASLVEALRSGRRIFANLQKALGYLFAVHVPIVGLSLFPVLGGPVLLLPLHVVLLELIIDPACSLVFEAEPLKPEGMASPPRRIDASLFSAGAIGRALAVGGLALLGVAVVQWLARRAGVSDEGLRLAGLSSLVVGNLLMLQWFMNGLRPTGPTNRRFHGLLLGVCALGLLALQVEAFSSALGLPTPVDAAWACGLLGVPAAWSAWRLAQRPRGPRADRA